MLSSASAEGLIIRVHGTGAGRPSDAGPAWWQNDGDFQHDLDRRLAGAAVTFSKVFHWSGRNSERDRQAAGEVLLEDWLLPMEDHGCPYHLIGHSHGGSVIWAALKKAERLGRPLEHLRSWTTVGTPFLHHRPEPIDRHLSVLGGGLLAVLVPLGCLCWMALGDNFTWWVILLSSPLTLALLPFCLFRAGVHAMALASWRADRALADAAFARYRGRWHGIYSRYDEAIQGLRGTPALSGEVMIRIQNWLTPLVGWQFSGLFGGVPQASAMGRLRAAVVGCIVMAALCLAATFALVIKSSLPKLGSTIEMYTRASIMILILAFTCFLTAGLGRLRGWVRSGLLLSGAGLILMTCLLVYISGFPGYFSAKASANSWLDLYRSGLRLYFLSLGTLAFTVLSRHFSHRLALARGQQASSGDRVDDEFVDRLRSRGAVAESTAVGTTASWEVADASGFDSAPTGVRRSWRDALILVPIASTIPSAYFLFRILESVDLLWSSERSTLTVLLDVVVSAIGLAFFGLAPAAFTMRRLGMPRRDALIFVRLIASTAPAAIFLHLFLNRSQFQQIWPAVLQNPTLLLGLVVPLLGLAFLGLAPVAYTIRFLGVLDARRRLAAWQESESPDDPTTWIHAGRFQANTTGFARFGLWSSLLLPVREVYGTIHNSVIAPVVDEFIWQRMRRKSQGNDLPGMVLSAVTEAPVIEAFCEPLPEEVDRQLLQQADEAARLAINRLRTSLGTLAVAGTNISQVAEAIHREEILTWRELIHNTYFDFEEIREQIADAILGAGPCSNFAARTDPPAEHIPRVGLREAINIAAVITLTAYLPLLIPTAYTLGISLLGVFLNFFRIGRFRTWSIF